MKLAIALLSLALMSCDASSGLVADDPPSPCYEDVAAATAQYCANFRHCKVVSFQANYANVKNCSVSVMQAMRGVLEVTDTPGECEGAILDYYDCFNPLKCEVFKALDEQTRGLGACLAESISIRYACGAVE